MCKLRDVYVHTHIHTHTCTHTLIKLAEFPEALQIMTIILAQIVKFVKTKIRYGIYEQL